MDADYRVVALDEAAKAKIAHALQMDNMPSEIAARLKMGADFVQVKISVCNAYENRVIEWAISTEGESYAQKQDLHIPFNGQQLNCSTSLKFNSKDEKGQRNIDGIVQISDEDDFMIGEKSGRKKEDLRGPLAVREEAMYQDLPPHWVRLTSYAALHVLEASGLYKKALRPWWGIAPRGGYGPA